MHGKTVIILGASRGIGAETAELLAARQARILLIARNGGELKKILDSLPGKDHSHLVLDLAESESAHSIMEHCKQWGIPDIVVWNYFARSDLGRLSQLQANSLSGAINRNCEVPLALYRGFLPEQKNQKFGRWILVSSAIASLSGPGQGGYGAVKSAQESLIRTIAVEQGHNGITGNIVRPGFIDTPGVQQNYDSQTRQKLASMNLPARAGSPKEVAAAIGYLASDQAGFVNGTVLPVDGGMNLGWFLRRESK